MMMRWSRLGLVAIGVFAVAWALAGSASAEVSAGSLGAPPKPCAPYEHLTSSTCLVQSWSASFTLSPHEVAPGGIVTATVSVSMAPPRNNPGAAAVGWQWASLAGVLGEQLAGCGPEKGSAGLVSRCKYRVSRTGGGGWQTVALSLGTYIGGAVSRDYFAVVSAATKPPPKPKQRPACPDPAESNFFSGAPKGAVGRVTEIDGPKAWIQHKNGRTKPLTFKTWILPGDIILTDPNTVVAFEFITGGRAGLNKNTFVRVIDESRVEAIPDPWAGDPAAEERQFEVTKNLTSLRKLWDKFSKRKEPVDGFDVPCGGLRG
jgi:hypothetical protein